ncbi:leucine-rich repeat domain-containing protein [Listeria innocua]
MINKQHFFKVAYAIMGVLLIGSIFIWIGSNNEVNAAEQSITEPTPINEIFPDANLADVMKGFLNKQNVTDTVTQEDLNKVTILGGAGQDIESIEGIQYLPNLTTIYLYNNKITDISLLADFTQLEILDISGNKINDFNPIANLTKLRTLGLSGTDVSDITFIANLTELTDIGLSRNHITDISPLANLTKVKTLYLSDNKITNLTALKNMKDLNFLNAGENEINDITGLADLTNIHSISLSQNKITDLNSLANLNNLRTLNLHHNEITDLTPLANLNNLFALNLDKNQITDIEVLTNLTNLNELFLGGNEIKDISPLANLTGLMKLNLSGNQISDVTPLANLTQLFNLWIMYNNITDISSLKGLTALTDFMVSNQSITNEPELFKTNFTLTNSIKDFDGNLVAPTTISHNGTYDSPIVTWNLSRYANEINYKYTQNITIGKVTTDHDVTVTQPFILPSHTVKFIVDDVLKSSLEVKEEALITQPAAPKKAGYTFTGWYDAKTGGNKWDFETTEMPRNDLTLYAQFSENVVASVDDDDAELTVEASGPVQESNDEVTVIEPTTSAETLPKTGDSNNMLFVVLGLLLFGTGVVISKKLR